jgi:hypothetical protein
MQTMNDATTPQGQPPSGYHQVLYWRLTEKLSRILLLNLLSIPLLIFWGVVFVWLATSLGRMPRDGSVLHDADWLPILLVLILIPVLHELVHGICMRIFGAHPRYGFLWKAMAFYATAPGYAFPRGRYLIIALAPLVVLSLAAVVLMPLLSGSAWVGLFVIIATLNATGAIGDMWITALVLRYPAHAYLMDERDGVRIFMPGEETAAG